MCQYDRSRLPVEMIDHALATHSTAIVDGQHRENPLYRPAADQISPAKAGHYDRT
jgi:hypothetical protein